jgi:hypothetical protein
VVKDKIREENQVEGRKRVGIWLLQRSEERIDGLSPHVSHHAHIAAPCGLDVLLDVEGQIVDERSVGVIREDDLY